MTRSKRSSTHAALAAVAIALLCTLQAPATWAAGFEMFSTSSFSTGEKPQSKLWYHDGSYWGILKGPSGVAFYEKVGSTWQLGTFANAVLTSGGNADVKWNGTNLFVLVYAGTSRLYKYTYDGAHHWVLVAGFPVNLPNPSGSETMVLDQDSSGRLWTTAEGGGNINVYYSTSADHKTWSSTPIVLQTGVNSDDICSIEAFGGNKVGVFWSDQNRDNFGFRVHLDSDAPTTWSAMETIFAGSGNADDHIHLSYDSSGRVYAVTKDDHDKFAVHRRATNGTWTTKTDVAGGTGTRPIIQVAESDSKVYVLYTRWGVSPDRIEYRVANISDLSFGGQVSFITSTSSMNNVTGMKQLLPPGSLVAVAENGSKCLYNSFGSPPGGGSPQPPGAPQSLVANLLQGPTRVALSWSQPSTGAPSGYNVYRSVNGGAYSILNGALVSGTTYTDNSPPASPLCYQVRAVANSLEGNASNSSCVDNTPPPPGAPLNLAAQLNATNVSLTWDPPSAGGAFAGYNVYRSLNGGAATKINAALVTLTSFTDNSPVTGNLCYTIKAQNAALAEGSASNSDCVSFPAPPGPPQNLTATLQGTDSTRVEWQAPLTGAAVVGYNIYRQMNGGSFVKLNATLVNGLVYQDRNLVTGTLCYQSKGVDALAREGTASNTSCVNVVAPPPPTPGAPQNLTAALGSIPGGDATGAAAYLFDEGSGQTAADATGHGHTGQLGSAAGIDTSDPLWGAGKVGTALLFDGSNDRASVPDANDLDFPASFTIEAWIQRGATGVAQCIVSKGDSQRRNYWMLFDGSNHIDFRWETSGGSNHGLTSSATITDAAWHHIACVYDQSLGQDRIYFDGVLSKQKSESGTPVVDTDPVLVGTRLSSGKYTDFFNGSIDLLRVTPSAVYTANFTPPTSFGGGPPQTTVDLAWQVPATGTATSYNVYRQVDGGAFGMINASAVTALAYQDLAPPTGALCYQVTAVNASAVPPEGAASNSACVTNDAPVMSGSASKAGLQDVAVAPRFAIGPNPFNPTTNISFRLDTTTRVSLLVFDVRGRRIATLVQETRPAGTHTVSWNGRTDRGVAVASGTYFAVLQAGEVHERRKLILLK